MQIELHLKEITSPDFLARSYNPDEDDVRSILIDVCCAIGNQGEFVVSGFGQTRWPLDVQTDLPIFLEQLPFALHAINKGMAAEIDFYEQGAERSIALLPEKDWYIAKCSSRTSWQPNPVMEKINRKELEKMLQMARERFICTLTIMAPELVQHQWIQQWLKGLPEEGLKTERQPEIRRYTYMVMNQQK